MVERTGLHGLNLCERVIIQQNTGYASLINCFDRRLVKGFPVRLRPFIIHAALSHAAGVTHAEVRASRKSDGTVIGATSQEIQFNFPDRTVRLIRSGEQIEFPAPGWYQFELLVDGEFVARESLELILLPEDEW